MYMCKDHSIKPGTVRGHASAAPSDVAVDFVIISTISCHGFSPRGDKRVLEEVALQCKDHAPDV
jgi:hypothetical protein